MVIDNHRVRGQFIESSPFAIKFPTENVDFVVQPDLDKVVRYISTISTDQPKTFMHVNEEYHWVR